MKKYILYARVASSQQRQESSSLVNQVKALKEYAKKNSLELGEVISEVSSSVPKERRGFNDMLKKLSTGRYQGILCQRVDRLSRDAIDFYTFVNLIEGKGMEIITTEEKWQNSPMDKFITNIMASVAEYNSNVMSERIKNGIKKAKLERKKS